MYSNFFTEIECRDELYIDGVTKLPKTDLIIDCRNIFGKRSLEIDLKLYISKRFLILDFQKEERYNQLQKGEYIIELKK